MSRRPARRPGRRRGRRRGGQQRPGERVDAQAVQAAIDGADSGPASTSTPAPGPVGMTSPSPDRCRRRRGRCRRAANPGGLAKGPPDEHERDERGERQRPVPAEPPEDPLPISRSSPAAARPRACPPAATATSGRAAARSATATSQRSGHRAPHEHVGPGWEERSDGCRARPSTVASGTAGPPIRLAGIETRLTVPSIPATSGAVARPAAALTASASATGGAARARSLRDQPVRAARSPPSPRRRARSRRRAQGPARPGAGR